MMPSYSALKALHILAAIVLVGAMLTVAVARPSAADDGALRARLVACNRWVATPALLVVLLLGLTMALAAGWFAAGWLQAKLALVLLLAALHGWQSRMTRLGSARLGSARARWPIAAVIVLTTAIATLAAVKP